MQSRRDFLRLATCSGAGFLLAPVQNPLSETVITVLHTNDTHSQIEPIPQNDLFGGKGGVARRATIVKRIRSENRNTLLVDAGDVFQGTPYFNLYKGEVEFRAMSEMGYDCMTLGNHEFDNGVASLAQALKFARFDIVSANYDVRGTALEEKVKPFVVREFSNVKVGIFGLGIKLEGLNAPSTYTGVKYLDPLDRAKRVIDDLKATGCVLIICLSHMGYYPRPKRDEFGDSQLASKVDGIDLIVSGHTHTFMERPTVVKQPSGRDTLIFQVGRSGVNLGRVDFRIKYNKVVRYSYSLIEVNQKV
jgi:5'-nucleotidase